MSCRNVEPVSVSRQLQALERKAKVPDTLAKQSTQLKFLSTSKQQKIHRLQHHIFFNYNFSREIYTCDAAQPC